MGCKQVFSMLLEASDPPDLTSFRETELFKKCQEMGIIPRSEAEREQQARSEKLAASHTSIHKGMEGLKPQGEVSGENALGLNLVVRDMWCPACAWVIEEALKRSGGVMNVSCNFSTDRVICEYDPVSTSPGQIIQTIEGFGYRASIPGQEEETAEKKREFVRFAISAFLTMNVMMLSFALYSGFFTELSQEGIQRLSFPIFVMASVVLFYGGRKIYLRAWAGMSSAAFSMETLITAGAFSAYLYSTVNILSGSIHLYYDTSSMLITLVLLGKALERRARGEVQEGLENFLSLRPTKVRICSDRYPEGRYAAAEQLQASDIFRVGEGEVIPADGLVVMGKGSLDESSLTGEAQPIGKKGGDRVKSGAKVIQGMFKVKAQGVGEESTLGQMITITEKALAGKTPLEGKTDRALQWFVPIILILAVGTGVFCLVTGLTPNGAMIRAVTVMVIACPCTLGIAIPLARVAGITLARRNGLLIRGFSFFEQAERVDAVVFDKTGTVTTGKWALRRIIPLDPFTERQVLAMAAALERDSDHYIAMELKSKAAERLVGPVHMERIKAFDNGISGEMDGVEMRIGSKAFLANELETLGIMQQDRIPNDAEHSLLFMGGGGRLCAIFVFGDKIRDGSSVTIDQLKAMGYKVALVSGDEEETTKNIAEKIGIEDAYGGKLPQDKVLFIAGLQSAGHRVVMVGDGINDAPALAQADLAMAVHSGGHLGKETADITLMRGDPRQVTDFIGLAKKVNRKIYQNLIFSFLYNFISIPVAMSGLLTPLIAVCAMLMSSLSVIGNTLLLVKKASRSS
ncbi:MAG: cation-translocating P-type ATPase [Deltaproteobacteria bacterium]|nr:MAG: cation-translocating P-type ATPase [Deltaproteobacteria bacterium]